MQRDDAQGHVMNLCDCYVTEVMGAPVFLYSRWWVRVKYNSWGTLGVTDVMCASEAEASEVRVGFHFLA